MTSLLPAGHYDPVLFEPTFAEALRSQTSTLIYSVPWLLAVEVDKNYEKPVSGNRELIEINIGDGGKMISWETSSLITLLRGEEKAPSLDRFPEEYQPFFLALELNVIEFSILTRLVPTDSEMREIYNALRRHPDGRSRGALHDHVWKSCALALATRPWSRHQFETVLGRLERSCRTFSLGPVSRNYLLQISQLRS